ncbi:MAG: PP2C family protein-serine/threonine phosphatase, partial [Spirochaetota bacterium]
KKNIVEYVNAGHTDLLYRKGKTGRVHIVNFKDDRPFKGTFLGIGALFSDYTPLKFKVSKEDILILYSDCLNESANTDMEEYGVEGILNALKNAPYTSAQDILSYIMKDFYSFIGRKNLNDDLSIIILRRIK